MVNLLSIPLANSSAVICKLWFFLLGIVAMVTAMLMLRQHPRKWKTLSSLIYVIGFAFALYALFAMHDPIEGIPSEVMTLIQIGVTIGGFYGFLYKIEHDLRGEFDDKLRDLKNDIHRDIDRIERKLNAKR
jgi:hypothetical protein